MIRFCFGRFGALKPTTKIEQKISVFKKMKTETDLKIMQWFGQFQVVFLVSQFCAHP